MLPAGNGLVVWLCLQRPLVVGDRRLIITRVNVIVTLIRQAARFFWNGENQAHIRQETGYNGHIERYRNTGPYVENNSDAEGRVVSLRHENRARGRVVVLRNEHHNRIIGHNEHSEVLLQNQVRALPYRLRQQLPDGLKCSKCMLNIRDAVIRDCGHFLLCQRCLVRLDHCQRCGRRIRAWNEVSWF
ncbi:uncharacterized protein LOC132736396 [Ruditapes philippinarum]|uniref:uncharacterized protein LOC132736396 n=1 Tax=Ruditapes philippinarum TaxID=129788 RepID=UPI00295AE690|nr:uncharacterized protein LOC132736396 [Ruditapes philippinarum]